MDERRRALQDVARVLQRAVDRNGPAAGSLDITPAGWTPHRGAYGAEYAGWLVELVEARNCGQGRGCVHGGSRRDVRNVGGPGGTCILLMLMSLGDERVRGFVHDGGTVPDDAPDYAGRPAPLCSRYAERPPPVKRGPRKRQATLFDVETP